MVTMLRVADGNLPVPAAGQSVYEVRTNLPWYDNLYALAETEDREQILCAVEESLASSWHNARVTGLSDVTWMSHRSFRRVIYDDDGAGRSLIACSMSALWVEQAFDNVANTTRIEPDALTREDVLSELDQGTPFIEVWGDRLTYPMDRGEVLEASRRIEGGDRDDARGDER